MPPPAGASRSRPPAACSPPTCPTRRAPTCSAIPSGSPPGCGRRGARRDAWTAAWSCPAGGRTAAASPTPSRSSPAASWSGTTRPAPASSPSRAPSSRCSTPGTRSGCAARAATTASPTSCSCRPSACSRSSPARWSDRPLYRFPVFGYFALSIGAAALGNARGMLDEFAVLAAGKVGRARAVRSPSAPRPRPRSPQPSPRCGRPSDVLRRHRGGVGRRPSGGAGAGRRCATGCASPRRTPCARRPTSCARSSTSPAARAIYDDSPLQRRFRDAHTATAHFQVNAASRELPGRMLLGEQADAAML